MNIPTKYKAYPCEEYFSSEKFIKGVYSKLEHLWVVEPVDQIIENKALNFLVIGRPGVDGIEFGYRKIEKGLWAYYPLENEFRLVAQNLSELVSGWISGKISV